MFFGCILACLCCLDYSWRQRDRGSEFFVSFLFFKCGLFLVDLLIGNSGCGCFWGLAECFGLFLGFFLFVVVFFP